jgi:hypothetical protein
MEFEFGGMGCDSRWRRPKPPQLLEKPITGIDITFSYCGLGFQLEKTERLQPSKDFQILFLHGSHIQFQVGQIRKTREIDA